MTTVFIGISAKQVPSQQTLKHIFDYNEDGYLTWRIEKSNRISIGQRAGYTHSSGYDYINLNNSMYRAHRLIWQWHYGDIDDNLVINHIDGEPRNNKISNLEQITQSANTRLKRIQKNNKSGIKGVSWYAATNKWEACISVNKKKKHLGHFINKFDAFLAYDQASQLYKGNGYRPQVFTGALLDEYNDYLASRLPQAA